MAFLYISCSWWIESKGSFKILADASIKSFLGGFEQEIVRSLKLLQFCNIVLPCLSTGKRQWYDYKFSFIIEIQYNCHNYLPSSKEDHDYNNECAAQVLNAVTMLRFRYKYQSIICINNYKLCSLKNSKKKSCSWNNKKPNTKDFYSLSSALTQVLIL